MIQTMNKMNATLGTRILVLGYGFTVVLILNRLDRIRDSSAARRYYFALLLILLFQ